MVDVDAEEIFNGRFGKFDAAIGKRRVNLVVAAPANFDACVAGYGKERRLVEARVYRGNHHGIGTPDIIFALVHAHYQNRRLVRCFD